MLSLHMQTHIHRVCFWKASGCRLSRAGLRAAREAVACVPSPLHVARHQTQHALVLVWVVVHVDHDWKFGLRLRPAGDVSPTTGAKEYFRVNKFVNVHHSHGDLRAGVVAVAGEPHLLVEHLLVPPRLRQKAVAHAAHEGDGGGAGAEEGAADVEGEELEVQAAAAPAHALVRDASKVAVGPAGGEAVRLGLQVGVAVEVVKGVLQKHQVHVRNEDAVPQPQDLLHHSILERGYLVRRVAAFLLLRNFHVGSKEARVARVFHQILFRLVVQCRD
mmetsp:Transcript_5779/g.10401  ORF Transcript_5779/g.10401 Transcript_5779/m.10401 type:complete len:274 (-) Transcript_5779:179-1000(-)